jgi:hypothetical protein
VTQFEPKLIEVGGDTYKVTLLDPKVAGDLLADLMAIVMPALAPLASAAGTEKASPVAELLGHDEVPSGNDSIERAVAAFFARFDKRKQREIVEVLAKVSSVVKDGKDIGLEQIFAIHFRGRLGAMYRWAWAALKVQYADFFDSVSPAIAAAAKRLGLAA